MKQGVVTTTVILKLGLITWQIQSAELELGVAAIQYGSPYVGVGAERQLLPWVAYRSERFSVDGVEMRYQLYQHKQLSIAAKVSPAAGYFDPADSSDNKLALLDKRGFTALAGVELSYQYDTYTVNAALLHDISGKHHGITSSIGLSRPFHFSGGNITLLPEIGLHYWDTDISNYYYGISAAESERSGLDAFRAMGKFRVQSGVTLVKPVSDNSKVFFNTSYGKFIGAYNSPALSKSDMHTAVIGWVYRF